MKPHSEYYLIRMFYAYRLEFGLVAISPDVIDRWLEEPFVSTALLHQGIPSMPNVIPAMPFLSCILVSLGLALARGFTIQEKARYVLLQRRAHIIFLKLSKASRARNWMQTRKKSLKNRRAETGIELWGESMALTN